MSVDIYKLDGQDGKNLPSCVSQDMDLLETYRYVMEDAADPRVADWPLMSTPFPIFGILLLYLFVVLHLGPRYMKNRKPYKLKNVMIFYNVFVAVVSAIVFYGLLTTSFSSGLTLGCDPHIVSYDPELNRAPKWFWRVILLKIFELGDTVIFVLRKKYNQTSFLHVYHHTTTVCLAWIACKFVPGGMWAFTIMLNCIVHVIMYTYYLLASFGPGMQKRIAPCKQYLTTLQMIQFVIILIHTFQSVLPSCEPDRKPVAYFYMSQVFVIFYMFWDYYKRSYLRKKTE